MQSTSSAAKSFGNNLKKELLALGKTDASKEIKEIDEALKLLDSKEVKDVEAGLKKLEQAAAMSGDEMASAAENLKTIGNDMGDTL
jgi:hypothetical protein